LTVYEARCKICTSIHKKEYEDFFTSSTNKFPWRDLEEKAKVLGEEISHKAFERHFTRHFSKEISELIEREGDVSKVVDDAKKEVINTVEEIKGNLNGLKSLLSKALNAYENTAISPQMLRGLTDLYREHRQSIESCERLTGKLTEGTNLSEAELLRTLYVFAKNLCPECSSKFRISLEEFLERKKK
jgi:hypothetical protein